jgi:hypothetical protein
VVCYTVVVVPIKLGLKNTHPRRKYSEVIKLDRELKTENGHFLSRQPTIVW